MDFLARNRPNLHNSRTVYVPPSLDDLGKFLDRVKFLRFRHAVVRLDVGLDLGQPTVSRFLTFNALASVISAIGASSLLHSIPSQRLGKPIRFAVNSRKGHADPPQRPG
jgi:hypothetical protein